LINEGKKIRKNNPRWRSKSEDFKRCWKER
jgi:hypothetical protein